MPTIINNQTTAVPIPEDGPLQPWEAAQVSRRWMRYHGSHRLKTPSEYNQMVRQMDRSDLVSHIKLRREHTDEDLTAKGETEELREQLFFEETDTEVA